MSLYIKPERETVLTDLSCLDSGGIRLLIMVQSAPEMFDRRQTNRETWMKKVITFDGKIKVLFIFGRVSATDANYTK